MVKLIIHNQHKENVRQVLYAWVKYLAALEPKTLTVCRKPGPFMRLSPSLPLGDDR